MFKKMAFFSENQEKYELAKVGEFSAVLPLWVSYMFKIFNTLFLWISWG